MRTSIETTSMYEAGGNLLWVNWRPPPAGKADIIAGQQPRWSHVNEVAERYYWEAAMVGGSGGRLRIAFPVSLLLHAESLGDLQGDAGFAGSLVMLVGHVWVWGWVVGMHTAIQTGNTALIRALWESALTVTLHVRVGMTDIAKAAVTIAESELRKTQDRIAGDSFVSFATKCCLIIDESPNKTAAKGKVLSELGVTYGGSAVTKAMLTAVLYFSDRFDHRAIELFRNIEYKHGREVMTGANSKLSRLGGLCSTVVWTA